jgi:hypothetical protein
MKLTRLRKFEDENGHFHSLEAELSQLRKFEDENDHHFRRDEIELSAIDQGQI